MKLKGRTIFKGKASGEAMVSTQAISLYGGVDTANGNIIEKGHELEGKGIKGKILVFPSGKGSTVGSYSLYRMKKNNTAPLAMVMKETEAIVAVGAIISEIPCVDKIDISRIKEGQKIEVNAETAEVNL